MTTRKLLLCCLAAIIALTGCSNEGSTEYGQEQQVTISLTALLRSDKPGIHYGDSNDQKVTTIRVMGFRHNDATVAFNHLIEAKDFTDPEYTAIANVMTGRYHIVIVANEKADQTSLHVGLDAIKPENKDRFSELDELYLDYASLDHAEHGIPMVSVIRNVTIQGAPTATKVIVDGVEHIDTWDLGEEHALERMLVRVDAAIGLTEAQYAALTNVEKIFFTNLPDKVYLMPRDNMPTSGVIASKGFGMQLKESTDPDEIDAGVKWKAIASRALLPESLFADESEADNGMRIALKFGNAIPEASLYSKTDNYTIPRNTYINLTGTVAGDAVMAIEIHEVTVQNWGTPSDVDITDPIN